MAATPMTVAYGPADHAYEVAASAEGPVGRGGRSRPIASFGLFHGVLLCAKGLIVCGLIQLETCTTSCPQTQGVRAHTATLRRSYTYTYTEAASVTGSVELYGSVYVCVEASTKKCELKYATQ